MGIRQDYKNYKDYKGNFDPYDPTCSDCGSDRTEWQNHSNLLKVKWNLHCRACDFNDGRKKKR